MKGPRQSGPVSGPATQPQKNPRAYPTMVIGKACFSYPATVIGKPALLISLS